MPTLNLKTQYILRRENNIDYYDFFDLINITTRKYTKKQYNDQLLLSMNKVLPDYSKVINHPLKVYTMPEIQSSITDLETKIDLFDQEHPDEQQKFKNPV